MLRSICFAAMLPALACGGIVGPEPGAAAEATSAAASASASSPTPATGASDDVVAAADAAAADDSNVQMDDVPPTVINPDVCVDTAGYTRRAFTTSADLLDVLDADGGDWATCVATTNLSFRGGTIGIRFDFPLVRFLFSDGRDGFTTKLGSTDGMALAPATQGSDTTDLDVTFAGQPVRHLQVSLFAQDATQMRLTDLATGEHADYVRVNSLGR